MECSEVLLEFVELFCVNDEAKDIILSLEDIFVIFRISEHFDFLETMFSNSGNISVFMVDVLSK